MTDLYTTLEALGIAYERYDHAPVYTCAEARAITPYLTGAGIKNLFLRDRKGQRHFLLIVGEEQDVDLQALAELLGVSRLSLASTERLQQYLKVQPGAVSILAVVNDANREASVVVDRVAWRAERISCHPLVNTATLVISRDDLERFCAFTGHTITCMDVPTR